eukprot:1297999-Rhodomonas_salina.1
MPGVVSMLLSASDSWGNTCDLGTKTFIVGSGTQHHMYPPYPGTWVLVSSTGTWVLGNGSRGTLRCWRL